MCSRENMRSSKLLILMKASASESLVAVRWPQMERVRLESSTALTRQAMQLEEKQRVYRLTRSRQDWQ